MQPNLSIQSQLDVRSDIVTEGKVAESQQVQSEQIDTVGGGPFDVLAAYRAEDHSP